MNSRYLRKKTNGDGERAQKKIPAAQPATDASFAVMAQKIESLEQFAPQRREDLCFAFCLLQAGKLETTKINQALEDVQREREQGQTLTLGQLLVRQRLIEASVMVQAMKEVSNIGVEAFRIPPGYEVHLSEEWL